MKRKAFLFPGQGAQYPGMGRDFFEHYTLARETFEEANDILGYNLSKIILNGPEDELKETRHSQTGIFVTSIAMLRVLQGLFPTLFADVCAGLSLGEYTALTASGRLGFKECLALVQKRGQYMNEACEHTQGTMAVVLGLDAATVEQLVHDVALPNDLWAANFNCPGQVVISGTAKGIEEGTRMAVARGAKRVLSLPVHGAFHSGLMSAAEEKLKPYIMQAPLVESKIKLVMNVTGTSVESLESIRANLIKQVTSPVRWEQGVRSMEVDLFIEIGCGKTLAGFNKRIGVLSPTLSIETIQDIELLSKML